jgi:two-component system nitrogen regulation sensor histidine kinase GlnL
LDHVHEPVAHDSPAPRASADAAMNALPVLNALSDAILVVQRSGTVEFANLAAEQFFDASMGQMRRRGLAPLLPADSPVFSLIEQAVVSGKVLREYGLTLETPRIGTQFVTLQAAPLVERSDVVVLSIQPQSIARKIDRQLTHRGAARSVTAMAAMLAHEIKNPLSGIRGAAQLLAQNVIDEDRALTKLICDETDRICALVDRMEIFTDRAPAPHAAVNIHEVLDHVKAVARAGFARSTRIREDYDPSLPPVLGDRDRLVQVFLNLVKNAAEAVPPERGEIVICTAYRQGVRLAVAGSGRRVDLPLGVSITDNGEGISEDIRQHLFEPFVTTKSHGTGMGLAIVAKIVDDHGGVVEFETEHGRTAFHVLLPVIRPEAAA